MMNLSTMEIGEQNVLEKGAESQLADDQKVVDNLVTALEDMIDWYIEQGYDKQLPQFKKAQEVLKEK